MYLKSTQYNNIINNYIYLIDTKKIPIIHSSNLSKQFSTILTSSKSKNIQSLLMRFYPLLYNRLSCWFIHIIITVTAITTNTTIHFINATILNRFMPVLLLLWHHFTDTVRSTNLRFIVLIVRLWVEIFEQKEEHDGVHADKPDEPTGVVTVDEQELERVHHNAHELDLNKSENNYV